MDAAKKLKENFLSCAICMEKFKDPCSIGCSHTFCRGCLATYTKMKPAAIEAKSIMCPTCREMTKVPHPDQPIEDWPKQFKPHFLIQSLLDDFGENVDAQGASNSQKGHNKHSQVIMCERHNACIDMCCQDCNKAICAKCGLLFHKKCNTVVPLESMVHEMRTAGMEEMAGIRSTIQHLKDNLQSVESHIKRTNENKAQLQLKIASITQQAIDTIKEKAEMLQGELEKTSARTVRRLKEKVVITESKMQKYVSDFEYMTKALESDSELELYQMYQMSKGLKFDRDIISPPTSIQLVEELKISEFKDSFELCKLKEVYENLGKPVLLYEINVTTEDEPYQDIFDVAALHFNEDDAIIITDCYNKAVTVIYDKGRGQQIGKLRFQAKPLTLSKLNERQVVISLQIKKEFVVVNVFPKLGIKSMGTTMKLYRCLTVLGQNRLAGACEDPPSVDIIDLSGNILENVYTAETGLSTIMREPWFISSTSKGHILLTDANSQFGVTALDKDGTVLYKRKTGRKDGTSGVTPGVMQGVIVADLFNYKVLELTETGEFCRELLTLKDGLKGPYGVCLHRGRLYVAEGEYGLRVYEFTV